MKKMFSPAAHHILPVLTLTLLFGCEKPQQVISLQTTLDAAVVDMNGTEAAATSLLDTDYLLLYFSAHWCPPCRTFTPKFVNFYNTQGGGTRFQAVLISRDKSEAEMFAYMRETKMPWPTVRFESESAETLQATYSGNGIPRLVLVDRQGTVIADSFEGKKYVGPQHVLNVLQAQLGDPQPPPPPTPQSKPADTEEFTQRFALNGLAKRGAQNIAIINGQVASAGTEIETGVIVERITEVYAELSFEGKRYRLHPQTDLPPNAGSVTLPKKR